MSRWVDPYLLSPFSFPDLSLWLKTQDLRRTHLSVNSTFIFANRVTLGDWLYFSKFWVFKPQNEMMRIYYTSQSCEQKWNNEYKHWKHACQKQNVEKYISLLNFTYILCIQIYTVKFEKLLVGIILEFIPSINLSTRGVTKKTQFVELGVGRVEVF